MVRLLTEEEKLEEEIFNTYIISVANVKKGKTVCSRFSVSFLLHVLLFVLLHCFFVASYFALD